jgi:RNA polymerase sigma-32 factor
MAQRQPALLFTPREIRARIRKVQRSGDPRALAELVRGHAGLVAKIARQFLWQDQDLDELMQVGYIGLLTAIDKFDLRRGVTLSTYAVPWIRAMIHRFALANQRLVRVSWSALRRDLRGDRKLLRHLKTPEVRLDAPVFTDEDATSRMPFLRAAETCRPDVQAERDEALDKLHSALARFAGDLQGRDRRIFEERWIASEGRTLASLGEELGVSRERTRQIEERILTKLERFLSQQLGGIEALRPALAG